jgi:hypothetical protein
MSCRDRGPDRDRDRDRDRDLLAATLEPPQPIQV